MKELPNLKELTDEAKKALIVKLWEELQKLQKQLEHKPKKTSKNSSLPPAKGFKVEINNQEEGSESKRAGSIGRNGGGRQLSENPDQTIKVTVKSCTECGKEIGESIQVLLERYDKIDIPPIKPIVTRIERYGCKCEYCGQEQIASVPVCLEAGSPFGDRIAALVTTMRYSHVISYGRMQQMLSEVFGLEISEGAIANLLTRVKGQLESEVTGILQALKTSRLECGCQTYSAPKRPIQRQNGRFVLPTNAEIVSMELMQETRFSLAG